MSEREMLLLRPWGRASFASRSSQATASKRKDLSPISIMMNRRSRASLQEYLLGPRYANARRGIIHTRKENRFTGDSESQDAKIFQAMPNPDIQTDPNTLYSQCHVARTHTVHIITQLHMMIIDSVDNPEALWSMDNTIPSKVNPEFLNRTLTSRRRTMGIISSGA